MVSFRIIATAAIAFAAPIFAQTTPAQVVTDLNTLAQQAKNLQPIASQITTINAPLIVIGQGTYFPPKQMQIMLTQACKRPIAQNYYWSLAASQQCYHFPQPNGRHAGCCSWRAE
jgi:hypothetical protein